MRTLFGTAAAAAALCLPVATAFAPPTATRPLATTSTGATRVLHSDKKRRRRPLGAVSLDLENDVPEKTSSSSSAPSLSAPAAAEDDTSNTDDEALLDVGKEIFLSNMQENMQVMKALDEDDEQGSLPSVPATSTSTLSVSVDSPSSSTLPVAFEQVLQESVGSSDNDNDATSSLWPQGDADEPPHPLDLSDLPQVQDILVDDGETASSDDMDAVNAVLEASKEAAAQAEASLLPDVFRDDFPTTSSATETHVDDDSTSSTSTTTVGPAAVPPTNDAGLLDIIAFPADGATSSPEILPASSVLGTTPPDTDKAVVALVQEEAAREEGEDASPSVGKILKFAIPATGVWLCSPLLSLIDTSSVGILSGTVQQAALNPAVAVTDYAALLIAFLYTGTTNLIASARSNSSSDGGVEQSSEESPSAVDGVQRTRRSLIGALQLSTFVGVGLGTVLFCFAKPLLRTIIGNDGISPAVFAAAMKYVKIRALGMPAAAVIGSAQAACLGMQDIKSPLYVLAVAAVVNFVGDMLFVGSSHRLIGGAAGAAWATVFSQYAAVAMFIHWLCHKPKQAQPERRLVEEVNNSKYPQQPRVDDKSSEKNVVNLSSAILELTGSPKSKGKSRREQFKQSLRNPFKLKQQASVGVESSSPAMRSNLFRRVRTAVSSKRQTATQASATADKEESFSVRGFLQGSFRGRDLLKPPSRNIVDEFKPYVMPVTSTQVGRVSGYVAMSHVVSSSLGTVSMAAQQVIVSLFYCLCPIADSLSLTAQSFVPPISEKAASQTRSMALRKTILKFAKAGAVFGAVMAGAVACIPLLSRFFTSDQVVISMVNQVVPLLVSIFSVHGIVCAAEGLLLGQKDLGFLGKSYAGYFFAVPWFMMRVKKAALSGTTAVGLTSVWRVFLGYQLFRCAAWMLRVGLIQRRTERATSNIATRSVGDNGTGLSTTHVAATAM